MSDVDVIAARSIEPLGVSAQVTLDEGDLLAAFLAQTDPNENLFYSLFGPDWPSLSGSQRLFVLARVAQLAEVAAAQNLNLTASEPEPK